MNFASFGPAGNSESFAAKGYKTNKDIPKYIKEFDLDTYEYQCGRGVKISTESAKSFGDIAKEYGISLSLHAPYYISLSSKETEKRDNSINYIVESARAADAMGATKIIVHSGSCAGLPRKDALDLACDTLKRAFLALVELGLSHIHICPETMGKINQLGDLDEVMQLCRVNDSFIPCIDFGHLNARTFGKLDSKQKFNEVIETVENQLGSDRLKVFHSHFSKIEYTLNGGEKKHLTFSDEVYGPTFEPLGEIIAQKGLTPTIICESAGTQAEDASQMKKAYFANFK
ncbi:MAG: TIM barrel protein [Oscillospiraceae bacterium]